MFSTANVSPSEISLQRKRLFVAAITPISLLAMTQPAQAKDCIVFFDNQAKMDVQNTSASNLIGAFSQASPLLGIISAGAVDATSKSNGSPTEQLIGDRIEKIDYFALFHSAFPELKRYETKEPLLQSDCRTILTFDGVNMGYAYGDSTTISVGFVARKYVDGTLVLEKRLSNSKSISTSPIPKKPRRKFEKDKSGKYIEITEKELSPEDTYLKFEAAYKITLTALFSKILQKAKT